MFECVNYQYLPILIKYYFLNDVLKEKIDEATTKLL